TMMHAGIHAPVLWLVGVLGAIPATDIAIALVDRAVTRGFGPSRLPGLALREGMSEGLRTLVAVPAMVNSQGGWELAPYELDTDLAIALVNRAVTRGVGASRLPGLALRDGIPEDLRTLVAMPVMLNSRGAVEQHLHQLEIHYLASPDDQLHFALLADFADAPA